MLTCADCGAEFERATNMGPAPRRCAACTSRRGRARGRVTTAAFRDRHPDRIRAYKALPATMERERIGAAKRYAADPAKQREINRRSYRNVPDAGRRHLLKSYGLTIEAYQALLTRQDGSCAICRKPESARDRVGRIRSLAVDHDHETGEVRGLLCHNCNIALGYLDEDVERMKAAAAYVIAARRRKLQLVEVI